MAVKFRYWQEDNEIRISNPNYEYFPVRVFSEDRKGNRELLFTLVSKSNIDLGRVLAELEDCIYFIVGEEVEQKHAILYPVDNAHTKASIERIAATESDNEEGIIVLVEVNDVLELYHRLYVPENF